MRRTNSGPATGAEAFNSPRAMRVKICIDPIQVVSAYVGENLTLIAGPTDFGLAVTHVEKSSTVVRGANYSSTLLMNGATGASMRVRVLADP